ncbi:hypothetical protein FNJ84_18175 [Paracoccus sp. M683]|uniref:hypothetical protein n=1 Tax=Paracoccus sp. M683 TaxID=2594268 RepID=UPI00117DA056|nr:hypothetical protein [Paracoccus sp. M683]TRW94795.1 hypothetical protein FNJ84_18175 [Paracoccus sp. M683]
MRMRYAAIGVLALLTACGAPPPPQPGAAQPAAAGAVGANELSIDTLSGGSFRGSAGSAWTRDEVAAQAASMECGGGKPAEIDIRPAAGGGHVFTGRC